jgi:hypothetical protein
VTEKPWLKRCFEGLKNSEQWHVSDMSFYSANPGSEIYTDVNGNDCYTSSIFVQAANLTKRLSSNGDS